MSETEGATTETTPTTEAPAGPDFSPVYDRIDQLGADMQQRMQDLMGRIPEPQQEEEPDPFDFSEYDTTDPAQAQAALRQVIAAQQQEALAPITAELQQFRADQQHQQLQALEQKYPQMQDPEYASKLIGQAVELAQQLPPDAADRFVRNPAVLESLHFAQMGRERAAGETPAGGQVEAGLEDASGGTPGGAETSLADTIRAGRQQTNNPFGIS